MSRRTLIYLVALLCGGAAALVPASSALAATGGASPGSDSAQPAASESAGGSVGTVSASGNGISLSTRAVDMLHNSLAFQGHVSGVARGTVVEVQRRGHQTGGQWANTARGYTDSQGNFTAVWPANHIGRFAVRAVPYGSGARSSSASPELTVTVLRSAIATIYGPGFWGSRTACGQILRKHTIGVANRTLPCGTSVEILYQGHTAVVPVIDRGPYANGADWDLTEATANELGITGTVRLGAVSLPR